MSLTLFRYLTERMVVATGILFLALSTLVALVDLIENLRFASKFEGAGFAFALQITGLRALSLSQAMAPFVFLFGALWMFAQLNRRSEIAVMRSAGLSIWRVIGPASLVAVIMGVIIIGLVDPISSRMMSFSENLKNDVRGKRSSLVRVFGDGIWLRQPDGNETLLVNAAGLDESTSTLQKVTVWRLSNEPGTEGAFIERVDAPRAILLGRSIELREAVMTASNGTLPRKTPSYIIPTKLTIADLREGAPPPETISMWDLPRFVELAEAAGLPTLRYNMRYHDLWSTPVKLFAMVLIAAVFTMRPARSGGTLQLVLLAVVTGFALYFLAEVTAAIGESGAAPLSLAAWTPTLVAATFAVTGLLHLEDG
ncbi:MAG: LptF/LptG family permease [Pseudomonadota bacterium]